MQIPKVKKAFGNRFFNTVKTTEIISKSIRAQEYESINAFRQETVTTAENILLIAKTNKESKSGRLLKMFIFDLGIFFYSNKNNVLNQYLKSNCVEKIGII